MTNACEARASGGAAMRFAQTHGHEASRVQSRPHHFCSICHIKSHL